MRAARSGGRRLIIPEVVQTSAMDCGPASLKCLLQGFGIDVSYGRLREACQTDVDGTSIDTMEEVAVQLGLQAEQVMIPVDHVLLPEARALPAIVVVRLPSGLTHFVVAWRRHGNMVQLMDPGTGRRWLTRQTFLDELYVHAMPVPAADWREWAQSEEFTAPLAHRLRGLGLDGSPARRLIEEALGDPSWRGIAALDGSTRMVDTLVRAGGLARGAEARGVLEQLGQSARQQCDDPSPAVPAGYWTVRPAPPDEDGQEQVMLRGAVLVRALGLARPGADEAAPPLSPELVAALEEQPDRPGRRLLGMLRKDGRLAPLALLGALALAAFGVTLEALLFRGLMELGRELRLVEQRIGAMAALLGFVAVLLVLELPIVSTAMRLGRHLELRLRRAFLEKIPRLTDSYFHSRLTSDMAERSHSIQGVRAVTDLGEEIVRNTFAIALTAAGLIWLDWPGYPMVLIAAAVAVVLPVAMQPIITERDLRVRSHYGALTRFYLDALLGIVPLRTHSAERAVRREHESLLVEWIRASRGLLRAAVPVQAVILLTGTGLAALLLFGYIGRAGERLDVLLYVFWALNLPRLGQQLAAAAQQYPALRNATLRLMEPLGAPERPDGHARGALPGEGGLAVRLEQVSVRAAGRAILEEVDLELHPGQQVAIVGPSGAGKSSLVGLLLGWHRAASGRVLVEGQPLDEGRLEALRQVTAWVDPSVQLWNRSLLSNLTYGSRDPAVAAGLVAQVVDQANLRAVLETLPDGLQTGLGEGGALVSGGEGQRVRLGRGLLRRDAGLVILDEPFRGLDREQRRILLERARSWWRGASLICITHDVGETTTFEQVLVVEGGRIVERGAPDELARREGSRYAAMLHDEEQVRTGLWASDAWRHLRLEGGRVQEVTREPGEAPR